MAGGEKTVSITDEVVPNNQFSAKETSEKRDHHEHMKTTPNWNDLREVPGFNPGFAAWLEAQSAERKRMWMEKWIADKLDAQLMFWFLEKVECNEVVAEAEMSVHNAPAEFQDAFNRNDGEAIGKFLAERMRNQLAGKEWK
jgi:hypothetical protein